MKASTTFVAAVTVLFSVFSPVTSSPVPAPLPAIQGRDFISRFAPAARPVFPRNQYDNTTYPSPTLERRDYAGPTASAAPWP